MAAGLLGSERPLGDAPVDVSVTSVPPEWGDYLASRAEATIYHDPAWGEVMRRTYGKAPHYLAARRDGRVVGILQLLEQRSLLFGSYLCSLPYFDASGILADDADARDALVRRAAGLREETRCRWVEFRQEADLGGGLPARTDKVRLDLPLPATKDELWDALKAKVRNQVRKAEKADLSCASGGVELLAPFHQVYVRNMRDLGSPPHGRRWFQAISDAFGASVRFFVVWAGSRPAAASLTLCDRLAARVPWAGSDWRLSDSCPNMLLYWTMLAECCGRAPAFDFGRSTRDSGTFSFKRQWGAVPVDLFWNYLLPEGESPPELRPDRGAFGTASAVWKKLPLWMVRALGPRIIGRLS